MEVRTKHPLEENRTLCTNQSTSSIIIQEPPKDLGFEIELQGDSCGPVSIDLRNGSSGDDLQFIWLLGADTLSTEFAPATQILPSGIEDTTYTILMAVNNNCGDNTQMKEVEVLALTKSDFGITFNDPCSGDSLFVNNISTGSPTDFRWIFSTGESFEMENPPVVIPFTDTLPRDISITLITENQCNTDTTVEIVRVNPTDVQALINSSDQSICLGDTLFLEAFTTPQAPFHWALEDGNQFTTKTIQHVFQEVDTFDIVLYTEGCGFDSMKREIIVLPAPEVDLVTAAAICEDAVANFTVNTNAEGHQLFFGDGDSTTLTISEHIYSQAGTFPIRVVATSIDGCENIKVDSILVSPLPIPIISDISDTLCVNELGRFQSGSQNALSCSWQFGDGNFDDGCEVSHEYTVSDFYTLQLNAISAFGCQAAITQVVFVQPSPTAAFAYEIIEKCSPAIVLFRDESEAATGIEWTANNEMASTSSFEVTFPTGGTKSVQLTASNNGLCFDTQTQAITLFDSPEIAFEIAENCNIIDGTDLSINTDDRHFVKVVGENYDLPGTFHAGLIPGNYTIQAASTDDCQAEVPITVTEIQELRIALNADSFQVKLGEEVTIEVEPNQTDVTYEWLPAEDLANNQSNIITFKPSRTANYTVIVTNALGCSQMKEAFVRVIIDRADKIFIPNSFTPNKDGKNDNFRIRVANPAVVNINYFSVFDKWGNIVFSTENFEPNSLRGEWDGTFRGNKAEMAVYTYQASIEFIDGISVERKGAINLIR